MTGERDTSGVPPATTTRTIEVRMAEKGWDERDLRKRVLASIKEHTGKQAGLSLETVRRWVRAKRRQTPSPVFWPALCQLFEVEDITELGFDPRHYVRRPSPLARQQPTVAHYPIATSGSDPADRPPPAGFDEATWHEIQERVRQTVTDALQHGAGGMNRRDFLDLWTSLAAVTFLPFDALERVAEAFREPGPVDRGLLTGLETLTKTLLSSYETAPPAQLILPARAHIATISRLLHQPTAEADRQRLLRLAAETTAIGRELAGMTNSSGEAEAYFRLAERFAREVDDPTVLAGVLGSGSALFSPVPTGGQSGDAAAALALLDEAVATVPGHAPARMRSWLDGERAVHHAATGDVTGFRRDMERAELTLRQAAAEEELGDFFSRGAGLGSFDQVRLSRYNGLSYVLLREPEKAEPILRATLSQPMNDRQRTATLSDLAAAYALLGEPEESCRVGGQSLTVACAAGYARGLERLRGVRARLDRWADLSAVRELDEQLRMVA